MSCKSIHLLCILPHCNKWTLMFVAGFLGDQHTRNCISVKWFKLLPCSPVHYFISFDKLACVLWKKHYCPCFKDGVVVCSISCLTHSVFCLLSFKLIWQDQTFIVKTNFLPICCCASLCVGLSHHFLTKCVEVCDCQNEQIPKVKVQSRTNTFARR